MSTTVQRVRFAKGDYYIPVNQRGARYIMETLEPQAKDSFFAWNFFDVVLQRKEGYSAYVFEDLAEDFLNERHDIKGVFEHELKTNAQFAKNPRLQLDFIYKKSPHYEKAYLKLPVYRVK